jgi:erythromycin esterase-like protein
MAASDRADENQLAQSLAPVLQPVDAFGLTLELIGDAKLVLIGEASHGTHEFYDWRADLTRHLIEQKGFTAVAAEADWPDAYRVNRHLRGLGHDAQARDALAEFKRFPAWMWRNAEVLNFLEWLRAWNGDRPHPQKVGFYGLDLYSLHASIEQVLRFLDWTDPEGARAARERYGCFDHFGADPHEYARATSYRLTPDCERAVVEQLQDLQTKRAQLLEREGFAEDEHFHAEQNARVVKNAEQYYRQMFHGRVASWNLRDTHMADTLDALLQHQAEKIVVWAHNSHVGDARATELGEGGELNLGQLARERHPGQCYLIGQTTHQGRVTAASSWDGPAERKRVRPSLAGSYERLFHLTGQGAFTLSLRELGEAAGALGEARLERAIGVLYLPSTERRSHYFKARLPQQFDLVVHFDQTEALEPLERTAGWESGEPPDTYPTGM